MNARIPHLLAILHLAGIATIALVASCTGASENRLGTWKVERDTIGDTIIVRTISGSVWAAPATMREEMALGALEGREELMLGSIQDMAVDASGGIYVFDAGVPALRYVDANGNYVRTLGGKGAGPGEYQDASLALAVRSDGRLVFRDPRNARLNIYNPVGTPSAHWPVSSGLFAPNAMVIDTADHAYLKILLSPPERNKPWNIGLLHMDDQGKIVDTIPSPTISGEPTDAGGAFLPSKHWAWSPLGYMVVGVNDEYRFELRPPDAPVIRVERAAPTVGVLPQERDDLEARNNWFRKAQGRFMTSDLPSDPVDQAAVPRLPPCS